MVHVVNSFNTFADETGVTYGGVTMTLLSGLTAYAGSTEDAYVRTYFLADPPTGSQTVVVSRNNTPTVLHANCATQLGTAGSANEIYQAGAVLLQGLGTYAVQSVTDGSPGTNSIRYAFGWSGNSNPLPAGTGSSVLGSIDFGSYVSTMVVETTAGQGARNVGFSYGTSDDRAAVHYAVRQVSSGPTPVTGTGAVSSVAASLAASGAAGASGTGAVSAVAPSLAATGAESFTGTGSIGSLAPTVAASGAAGASGTGGVSIAGPTLEAGGVETFTATGSVSLVSPSLAASGTVEAAAPEAMTGTGAVSAGVPVLSAAGAVVNPVTGSGGVRLEAPRIEARGAEAFTGTGGVTLAAPVVAIVACETFAGTGGVSLGAPTLATDGAEQIIGRGFPSAPLPVLAGVGAVPMVGAGAVHASSPELAGVGSMTLSVAGSGGVVLAAELAAKGWVETKDGQRRLQLRLREPFFHRRY